MHTQKHAKKPVKARLEPRKIIFAALLVLFCATGIFAAVQIIIAQMDYAGARKEYDMLKQYAPINAAQGETGPNAQSGPSGSTRSLSLAEMNPDYEGWIKIEGTAVDYPVVQGPDNEKYLDTTFSGEYNPSGSIFMDIACTGAFDAPLWVVYGHNMRDGSMFAALTRYLNGDGEPQPDVLVVTAAGDTRVYRVIAARLTDINDTAYTLRGRDGAAAAEYFKALGAPDGARHMLMLSTCTSTNENSDERILVFAAA